MTHYQSTSGTGATTQSCGGPETELRVRDEGTYVVLEIDGPLALSWISEELGRVVRHLIEGGKEIYVLDLAQAPYADSAGIGALAATLRLIQTAGGKLVLLSVQPRVWSLLARLRLDPFFSFSDDRTFAFIKS